MTELELEDIMKKIEPTEAWKSFYSVIHNRLEGLQIDRYEHSVFAHDGKTQVTTYAVISIMVGDETWRSCREYVHETIYITLDRLYNEAEFNVYVRDAMEQAEIVSVDARELADAIRKSYYRYLSPSKAGSENYKRKVLEVAEYCSSGKMMQDQKEAFMKYAIDLVYKAMSDCGDWLDRSHVDEAYSLHVMRTVMNS